jgi:hypothetical protein|tara:strand:- start:298 stop:981 length:684 start_codon:yes stop_codon:yes gene_type:complete
MIVTIPFDIKNIANKLQLGVGWNTAPGQKMARENHAEHVKDSAGNLIHTQVADKPYLITSSNNYFLIEGKIRLKYIWAEGDEFDLTHLNEYEDIMNAVNTAASSLTRTTNSITADYVCKEIPGDWSFSGARIEPNCLQASVEILTAQTVIICPMQYQTGWTFEKIDIPVGGTVTSTKVGTEEYIFFGQSCTVGAKGINKHDIKKQTSASLDITNNSDRFCRLVRIYK